MDTSTTPAFQLAERSIFSRHSISPKVAVASREVLPWSVIKIARASFASVKRKHTTQQMAPFPAKVVMALEHMVTNVTECAVKTELARAPFAL